MTEENPEIGLQIKAADIETNYHIAGSGPGVLLIHGSGPGVSAWANWRLVLPELAKDFQVIAPDMVGFGFTERPDNFVYNLDNWVEHAIGILNALEIKEVSVVGNSYGGAVALALAIRYPERVQKLVLMGSGGTHFELTEGLDKTWGYTPSLENMKELLDIFAYDRNLVSDELAELRYGASIRPGFQESFEKMFPAPRQNGIEGLCSNEDDIKAINHETLIIHGREDQVIPKESSYKLFSLIHNSQLHIFGRCGHWVQIEHTERFNRLVTDFLMES